MNSKQSKVGARRGTSPFDWQTGLALAAKLEIQKIDKASDPEHC